MAKKANKTTSDKKPAKTPVSSSQVQPQDRTNFYTDIAYMPAAMKNELWFAQQIFFAKKTGVPIRNKDLAKVQRDRRKLKINEQVLKQLFDPKTPSGKGNNAAYMATNWKTHPLYIHLNNIVRADITKKAINLQVSVNDEYAVLARQKENEKILYRRELRKLINLVNVEVGLEPIKDSQDPYKYIQKLEKKNSGEPSKDGLDKIIDNPVSYIDLIRNSIEDSEDIALFNELIYKGDIEIALELGIQYYMMKENKWDDYLADKILTDIKADNRCVIRKYTDETTGRPVLRYGYPEDTYTNVIKMRNGDDLMFAFEEEEVTFGDFVREIGGSLTNQQMVNIFEWYRQQGTWTDYKNYAEVPWNIRDSTRIRIGFFSVLTQDYDVFADGYVKGNESYHPKTFDWQPSEHSQKEYGIKREEKHYNVWYSCYYIPPTAEHRSTADFQWQANFVFKIKKNLTQYRYGQDQRYCKSEYIIWKDDENASFDDVMWMFMPFINVAWIKFQNAFIHAIPNGGQIIARELLQAFVNSTDSANKDGKTVDAQTLIKESWDQLRQTGKTTAKFTDSKGEPIVDPQKFIVNLGDKGLEESNIALDILAKLYVMLKQSLAISDLREGLDLEPRQTAEAGKQALDSSRQGTWFVEKPYIKITEMVGERMVQHIHCIFQEAREYGDKERLEEFMSLVGLANGMMLEAISDIPIERFGISVSNEDISAKKEYILNLADTLAKAGMIDIEIMDLLLKIDNWKYAFMLMKMNYKKKKKEKQQEAMQAFQQDMALKQEDLKIAMALQSAKTQDKNIEIQTQAEMDARLTQLETQLKTESMLRQQQQRGANKMEENLQKSQLNKDQKTHEKNLDEQQAFNLDAVTA